MAKNCYELVVSEGRRPAWRTLSALLLFTVLIFNLIYKCWIAFNYELGEGFFRSFARQLEGMGMCFSAGVILGTTRTILIDVDTDKLIRRYELGMICIDRVSEVPQLDYISVFRNAKEEFEVNLWYSKNRHFKMCAFNDSKHAFDFAKTAAGKLNIGVLDATVKGNFRRITETSDETIS